MAAATNEGDANGRTGRSGAEYAAIVCTAIAAVLAIPYVVLGLLYLGTSASCDSDTGGADPMAPLGVLALLFALAGIVAGIAASPRRSFIGMSMILVNVGLIILGIVILGLDFQHTPLGEFCF